LLKSFGAALVVTGIVLLLMGVWHWRGALKQPLSDGEDIPIASFDLSSALVFGAFLGAMAVAVPAAKEWLGTSGIYTVSALSGLLDVDAIVISLARIHRSGAIPGGVAIISLCLAILANMLTKVVIAWVAGGRAIGKRVMQGYGFALLAGAIAVVPAIM
jgi:uncharacterized membrane protein (DUF4010 family)